MAEYNTKTIKIKADSSKGVFIDSASTGIGLAQGYVTKIPDLWYDDSYEIIIECYEDYLATTKHNFGSGATANLYIKLKDSESQSHLLDQGTVTQLSGTGNYYIVTFDVESGDIPDYLAGQDCILYAEITGTDSSSSSSSSSG